MISSGLLAGPATWAPVVASTTGHDRGEPQRALDLRAAGGIDLRLLPDRGLDIAGAWFAGLPLHWSSRVGERQSRPDFVSGFGGGLLLTCGLDNVGPASEGYPTHGTFTRLPAHQVTWNHDFRDGEITTTVRGIIDDADALTRFLRCERTITTRTGLQTGTGEVTVTDIVTNHGAGPVESPMLYHVNLGPPLWQPGSVVDITSDAVNPRDDDAARHLEQWRTAPPPRFGEPERVFEHRGAVPRVTVHGVGLVFEVSWDDTTMNRLHQWVHPAAGVYALGIEPANCSVLGRSADRSRGELPTITPGAQRRTTLRLHVRHASQAAPPCSVSDA